MKKILPFEGQLDLTTAGGPDAGDDVDDMIQKLDMAMQVKTNGYPANFGVFVCTWERFSAIVLPSFFACCRLTHVLESIGFGPWSSYPTYYEVHACLHVNSPWCLCSTRTLAIMLYLFLVVGVVFAKGFELDFEPVVARLFNVCDDADKLGAAVQALVERYLSVELLFAGKANEDAVIADLIKAHKDDPEVNTCHIYSSHRCCFLKNIFVESLMGLVEDVGFCGG